MLKTRLKNKYENYKETKGTINILETEDDKANQTRKEEVDIRLVIEKYGIMPIELLNRAKEPLFLNNLGADATINEKLKYKEEIGEYFDTLPAKIRKEYKDSKEYFYECYQSEKLDNLIEQGILTGERAEYLLNERKKYENTNNIQENIQNGTSNANNSQNDSTNMGNAERNIQ